MTDFHFIVIFNYLNPGLATKFVFLVGLVVMFNICSLIMLIYTN